MSIEVSTYVWRNSSQKGSGLLLLLAIADMADHSGVAFPSIKTLSDRIRMSERSTQRLLAELVERGELLLNRGGGRNNTNLYQIVLNETIPLFPATAVKGDKLTPPLKPKGCHSSVTGGVTKQALKGDIAVSPESLTVNEHKDVREGSTTPPGPAQESEGEKAKAPSAVAAAFKAYQDLIRSTHGGEYPPSARANGQLANIAARLCRDALIPTIQHFFSCGNPYYAKVAHSLEILSKDAEKLWLEAQRKTGTAKPKAITAAFVSFAYPNGAERKLQDYPVGDPHGIAVRALKEYARMAGDTKPKTVIVRLGAAASSFSVDELLAVA